ncbi:MAG TPA: S1 family peptidase [Candidatus Cybelea sp.]|nr:S1 family peptidase [Candidatus Cybelea sp.]
MIARTGPAAIPVIAPLVIAPLVIALSLLCAQPAGAIINGKPVVPNDAYAHSVVGLVPVDQYGHPGACTGILLTPQAVLTAAHCVSGDVKSVSVVFDLTIGETHKVAVTRTVINPAYKDVEGKFNPGDIAVIFLAAHNFPTTIMPLDRDDSFKEGEQFVFLGYGRGIAEQYDSTGILRKAAIAATGRETPREVELQPLSNAWPCDGDSGGPVLRKDMSGHYAVSGVMDAVYAGPIGECLFKASFMTPIHAYADWISSTLAEAQATAQKN